MSFEVQRGVAVPVIQRERTSKYPWAAMEVGDFFFVPCEAGDVLKRQGTLGASARTYCENNGGGRFVTRHMTHEGVEGVGVWRKE